VPDDRVAFSIGDEESRLDLHIYAADLSVQTLAEGRGLIARQKQVVMVLLSKSGRQNE
jgi:hypothetical protein